MMNDDPVDFHCADDLIPSAAIATPPSINTSANLVPKFTLLNVVKSLPGEHPDHRTSCHRCGNIRKKSHFCTKCPYVYCFRCVVKMQEVHGAQIFSDGCPVCKDLCCCGTKKSFECTQQFHCYKKCPVTRPNTMARYRRETAAAAAAATLATAASSLDMASAAIPATLSATSMTADMRHCQHPPSQQQQKQQWSAPHSPKAASASASASGRIDDDAKTTGTTTTGTRSTGTRSGRRQQHKSHSYTSDSGHKRSPFLQMCQDIVSHTNSGDSANDDHLQFITGFTPAPITVETVTTATTAVAVAITTADCGVQTPSRPYTLLKSGTCTGSWGDGSKTKRISGGCGCGCGCGCGSGNDSSSGSGSSSGLCGNTKNPAAEVVSASVVDVSHASCSGTANTTCNVEDHNSVQLMGAMEEEEVSLGFCDSCHSTTTSPLLHALAQHGQFCSTGTPGTPGYSRRFITTTGVTDTDAGTAGIKITNAGAATSSYLRSADSDRSRTTAVGSYHDAFDIFSTPSLYEPVGAVGRSSSTSVGASTHAGASGRSSSYGGGSSASSTAISPPPPPATIATGCVRDQIRMRFNTIVDHDCDYDQGQQEQDEEKRETEGPEGDKTEGPEGDDIDRLLVSSVDNTPCRITTPSSRTLLFSGQHQEHQQHQQHQSYVGDYSAAAYDSLFQNNSPLLSQCSSNGGGGVSGDDCRIGHGCQSHASPEPTTEIFSVMTAAAATTPSATTAATAVGGGGSQLFQHMDTYTSRSQLEEFQDGYDHYSNNNSNNNSNSNGNSQSYGNGIGGAELTSATTGYCSMHDLLIMSPPDSTSASASAPASVLSPKQNLIHHQNLYQHHYQAQYHKYHKYHQQHQHQHHQHHQPLSVSVTTGSITEESAAGRTGKATGVGGIGDDGGDEVQSPATLSARVPAPMVTGKESGKGRGAGADAVSLGTSPLLSFPLAGALEAAAGPDPSSVAVTTTAAAAMPSLLAGTGASAGASAGTGASVVVTTTTADADSYTASFGPSASVSASATTSASVGSDDECVMLLLGSKGLHSPTPLTLDLVAPSLSPGSVDHAHSQYQVMQQRMRKRSSGELSSSAYNSSSHSMEAGESAVDSERERNDAVGIGIGVGIDVGATSDINIVDVNSPNAGEHPYYLKVRRFI